MLLHVRLKVACDFAEDTLERVRDELGPDSEVISWSGDAAHFLVPQSQGAAVLAHRARVSLSQTLIEDYGIVGVVGLAFYESEPTPDEGDDDDDDYYYWSLGDWWAQFGPPRLITPGFRRWGLLLILNEDRRENSKVLDGIRRHLGPSLVAHWHSRQSIFLTFWAGDEVYDLIDQGPLAKAVRHPMFDGAFAFVLTNDFEAKYGGSSTLASWFARAPSFEPSRSTRAISQRRRSARAMDPARPVVEVRRSRAPRD